MQIKILDVQHDFYLLYPCSSKFSIVVKIPKVGKKKELIQKIREQLTSQQILSLEQFSLWNCSSMNEHFPIVS